ncbi:MAG TPA: hypothetical protein VGO61_10745 [Steroidobacteraceae bacterium]|jgi:heme/copper-type cytochrome/quinol oxidase subunit 2|nr:hypothetical protein [Steroidobacteraceae bacterium]
MELRVAFVCITLVIALVVFIAMLVGLWRHQAHARVAGRSTALVSEYVWSTVPWIIVVLCATPAVHHFFAAG